MKQLFTSLTLLAACSSLYSQQLKWQGRAGAVSTSSSYTGAYIETGFSKQKNGLNLQYVWLDYCWCPCGDSTAVPDPVNKMRQTNVLYQRSLVSKKNLRVTAEAGLGVNQVFYREQRTAPIYKNGELVTPGSYTPPYYAYKASMPINLVTEFSPGRKKRQPGEKVAELWLGLRTGLQYVNGTGAVVVGLHLALTY